MPVYAPLFRKGLKTNLQNIALNIISFCVKNCVILDVEWIPRTLNGKAEYFSKIVDFDDLVIVTGVASILQSKWVL